MSNPIETTDGHSPPPVDVQLQDSWNYEATVVKVETILRRIEAGELELAEVFDEFATAVEYLRQCQTFLQEHQRQMDLLIETLADESESF